VTIETLPQATPTPAAPVDVERWRTIAASETTGTSPAPLAPARDPAGASVRCLVTWAGACRTCRRPIWSATWPGKGAKYCPGDGGGPAMRLWEPAVDRGGPSSKPLPRARIPGRREEPSADPPKQRGFETGLYDARTRLRGRRGGRPRVHPSRRAAQAAAAQAYRARQRARLAPGTGAR
jgi:hypothetical protein